MSAGRAVARRRFAGLIATAAVGLAIAASLSVSGVPDADAADQFLPAEVVGSTDALVSTTADSLPWGVVGLGDWSHVSTNLRIPVFAIADIGDRVFVGGMFARAQRGPGGRTVDQPFLAAFDKATGEMIEDWRPQLDAPVYALVATTDGKLIVGGDFTNVNGQPFTAALAALDPATGAVVPTWRSHLERPWSDLDPVVRALAVHDGHVYAAGNFSHQESFASRTRVYKAIRVTEADGTLDTAWLPQVTGAGLWALGVSPDGSRVTLGGFHSAINGSPDTRWIGVVDGATGATIPGLVYTKTHSSSGHIQGVADTGDSLYYTGSQHFIFRHDTTTWAREAGVTYTPGGDGQAIEIADGILYNACHCIAGRAWLNSYSWPTASPGAIRRDANGIVAFSESDFGHISSFYPEVYYENGDGPWDLHMDDRGCLWVGGDVYRLDTDQPYRWARGFTRLCREDADGPDGTRRPRRGDGWSDRERRHAHLACGDRRPRRRGLRGPARRRHHRDGRGPHVHRRRGRNRRRVPGAGIRRAGQPVGHERGRDRVTARRERHPHRRRSRLALPGRRVEPAGRLDRPGLRRPCLAGRRRPVRFRRR